MSIDLKSNTKPLCPPHLLQPNLHDITQSHCVGWTNLVNGLASFVQQNPKLEDAQILLGDHLPHMWGQFATNPGSFGAVGHTAH